MDITEKIIEIIGADIWQKSTVPVSVLVFDKEVREACQKNYCGNYGRCWTCPPYAGESEAIKQKLTAYSSAFIFTTKHTLEDSFDYDGMKAAHMRHDEITRKIADVCAENNALILGAGRCSICEECTCPDAPCRFPDRAIVSIEACGINVMALSKTAGINYINGANTVTYFTAVLFN